MIERIAYTVAEVAEMTGIPYGTVLAEIRAGNIAARRAGVSYYVHRDTLDGYLKCPAPKNRPGSGSDTTLLKKVAEKAIVSSGSYSTRVGKSQPVIAADTAARLLKNHL